MNAPGPVVVGTVEGAEEVVLEREELDCAVVGVDVRVDVLLLVAKFTISI